MATEERIEGKVLTALGNREVLIDRGSADGVEIGMRFVILDEGTEIKIPDVRTPVIVRRPKTIVKIVRLEGDSASVGRTFLTIKGSPGALSSFSAEGILGPIPDRVDTFKYEDPYGLTDDKDRVIRPGDTARQTVGDEYTDE